jgi:hypothetical protein
MRAMFLHPPLVDPRSELTLSSTSYHTPSTAPPRWIGLQQSLPHLKICTLIFF